MSRIDYAFPFRIDPASGQAARAAYGDHVQQMIVQLLLTDPGERVDRPEFGCGLRRLLFAPNADSSQPVPQAPTVTDALHASTRMIVSDALERWLVGQVIVNDVTVDRDPDAGTVTITVSYVLVETRSLQQTQVVLN